MFPTTASSTSAGTMASASANSSTATPTVNENMFLQLLVAQLENQDPLSPADGTQFLTQLAQFTQLEQSMSMSSNLSAIRADLDQLVPNPSTATTET